MPPAPRTAASALLGPQKAASFFVLREAAKYSPAAPADRVAHCVSPRWSGWQVSLAVPNGFLSKNRAGHLTGLWPPTFPAHRAGGTLENPRSRALRETR